MIGIVVAGVLFVALVRPGDGAQASPARRLDITPALERARRGKGSRR